MTRHELREQAFRMLFGVEFHTEDRREALENYMDVTFDGKMTEAERQEVIEKVLDIDGDCGGFNLQWAWSSGRMAGESAAAGLRRSEE